MSLKEIIHKKEYKADKISAAITALPFVILAIRRL